MPQARHNLPLELTSFVGRERELAVVTRLVREHRLVTLTGPGGSGKTRLSRRAAAGQVEELAGGVWLAELAPVTDPSLVVQVVADALRIAENPGQPLLETLCERLAGTELLLLVDNCEHLIDACSELAQQLLIRCPGLRLLATSREPLYVTGEVTWSVPVLEAFDALRLFTDRARLANPELKLDRAAETTVGQICERLDRLPLAIELAAVRARSLSLDEIAGRLDDRFRLLRGGPRGARKMHEALETCIAWSYDLLGERERLLFRRLAVFRGSFDLTSVEAVCGLPPVAAPEMLGLVSQLVDRSLVLTAEDASGARFRVLESLREYASQQLEAHGEASEIVPRHAQHYLALASQARSHLTGPDQLRWLATLDADQGNLRTALDWSTVHDPALQLGLAGALGEFWWQRTLLTEGRDRLAAALALDSKPSGARGLALLAAARIALPFAAHKEVRRLAGEALELYDELGDISGIARACNQLAWVDLWVTDLEAARTGFERGLESAQRADDREAERFARWGLGHVCWREDDLESALGHFESGLRLARDLGGPSIIADALDSMGHVLQSLGRSEQAEGYYRDSLSIYLAVGDRSQIAHLHNNLADLALDRRDPAVARLELREALAILTRLGVVGASVGPGSLPSALESCARLAVLEGRFGIAILAAGSADAMRERLDRRLSPVWQRHLDEALAPARSALGAQRARRAFEEGRALAPEDAAARAIDSGSGDRPGGLSARQVEIAELVASGLSNPQIGRRLSISRRTVDTHVQNIKLKLGLHSRVELARWAAEHAEMSSPSQYADLRRPGQSNRS
ncbi:MAG TPA: LuxR C-terminal-related transcriptional regulator [Candidatus Dormibacteraeota bacterium]|nr:LuxR C-terminal-related transcriptional regulator [Candidatus Dormibacteraeota bacterium]